MTLADVALGAPSRKRKVGSVKFLSEITSSCNNNSNNNSSGIGKAAIVIKPILKQAHSVRNRLKGEGDKKVVVFTEAVAELSPSTTPTATTPGTAVDSTENVENTENVPGVSDHPMQSVDKLFLASHSVFDPTSIDSLDHSYHTRASGNAGSTNSSTGSNLSLLLDYDSISNSPENFTAGNNNNNNNNNNATLASIDSITMTGTKTNSALVYDINMYKNEIKHIKLTIKDLKRQKKCLTRNQHRVSLCKLFSRQH